MLILLGLLDLKEKIPTNLPIKLKFFGRPFWTVVDNKLGAVFIP